MPSDPILTILEQLYKSAVTGENYANNEHDRHRYKDIKEKVEMLYQYVPNFEKTILNSDDNLGYITPKVGVNAIIQNDQGAYLLEKRADDGSWGIIGGWAEPGYTAEENIIREIREETGLEAEVISLIDVMSRKPTVNYIHTSFHLIFYCTIKSGDIRVSHESEEIAWKKINEIDCWHSDHLQWLEKISKSDFKIY